VLGLNWRANFVVSLLISVFSFHLFFNPSHHNLYRRHHFFPHPQNLSAHLSHQRLRRADLRRPQQTLHRTTALPRGAFRRTGSVPVRSLRLKKSKATRQQIKKRSKKNKTKKNREEKTKKKNKGRSVQQFFSHLFRGRNVPFSSFAFIFPVSVTYPHL
jgi:hypothetical protein